MDTWFSARLIGWYRKNKRDLPWRDTRDPYKIWLSEIILQQTQVKQGLAYYYRFIEAYPDFAALAAARQDEVLKLWQGLGYYSRARNMHAAAQQVVGLHKGSMPRIFEEIRSLKGVGDYTAAAIASFAFGLPQAVVDGNVYRLLSRMYNITDPIDNGAVKKRFQQLAQDLLDRKRPAEFNQAIMEFGSQFCKPANPDCSACVFSDKCLAFSKGTVAELPRKEKKVRVRKRYFNYIVMMDRNSDLQVRQRGAKDIWQGLFEFPLIETVAEADLEDLAKMEEFRRIVPPKRQLLHRSDLYQHTLTHQQLSARFYVFKIDRVSTLQGKKVGLSEIDKLAVPRLIEKFLSDCDLKEIP